MSTLATTLSTRKIPRTAAWLGDFILILVGVFFIALLAQVKIPLPFTPVPITGQTFAVLLVGATLGSKRSLAVLLLYLAMGLSGLPFFAGGASGIAYSTGPTLGYLVGFVVAAYVVGLLAERGLERSVRTSLVPFLVGTLIIYLIGAGWLAILFNVEIAFTLGVAPFIVGDIIKMVLAALVLPATWRVIE